MDASQTTEIQAPGLGRKIGLAWAALAWEGLWPRLGPLLAFAWLFVAGGHSPPRARQRGAAPAAGRRAGSPGRGRERFDGGCPVGGPSPPRGSAAGRAL